MSKRNRIVLRCGFCNNEYEYRWYQSGTKFCSHACYYYSRRTYRQCRGCGATFFMRKNTGNRFCSRECVWQHKRVNAKCETCGRIYSRRKSYVNLSKRRFCSFSCYDITGTSNPNWKGGATPEYKRLRNHPKYKEWRNAVFERDKYTCQTCNQVGGRLHAHHKTLVSENLNLIYDINNGKTLCDYCHDKEHPQCLYKEKIETGVRGTKEILLSC